MIDKYGKKYPGSGTANPFGHAEQWHPLKNVTWAPKKEMVEVETCENVRIDIPAETFGHWLKQKFFVAPKYREGVLCKVEKQMRQTGMRKVYER